MITISDNAKKRLLDLQKKEGESKKFVRVGVESGGCSGLSYKLDFDNKKNEYDELIEDNGVKLLVNKKSFLYLVGTTLEFSDGLNGMEKDLCLITQMQVGLVGVEKVFLFKK